MKVWLAFFIWIYSLQAFAQLSDNEAPTYFSYNDTAFCIGQKMVKKIIFGAGRHGIWQDSYRVLDTISAFLLSHPSISVEIGVFTDCRGSELANTEISKLRGSYILDYFMYKKLPPERISIVGYGESQPLNRCVDGVKCTEEEHAENRRVEFKITAIIK